jgi:pimeloyl-ACP methyl ester carboxylesterase
MALADLLELDTLHVAGHSSGGLIAFQMAADRPELVHSLILIEPAACGPFQVPAFAELGERFVGPAMGAFSTGDLQGAFDTFMRGVCGNQSRDIIERSLGRAGYEQAIRESQFFFRDEVPACMEWQFVATGAISQPVLVVEGADGRKLSTLSRQVTERATTLLPQAEVVLIEDTNHMLPLQDPDALAQALAGFIRRHPIGAPVSAS